MFSAFILAFCVTEVFATHFIFWGSPVDINLLSGMLTACAWVSSANSQRDKSVGVVVAIWWAYCLATDRLIDGPVAISMEATAMTVCVFWAMARPYFYPSDEYRPGNVCIAFYKGTNAPFLSSLASLVGLPFASVAIVTGDTALRASGCGKMVLSPAKALLGDDYVLIDTGMQGTPPVFEAIKACVGKPTRSFGVFRTRCVYNLLPVLKEIGYTPRRWWLFVPSLFYFQVSRQAHP